MTDGKTIKLIVRTAEDTGGAVNGNAVEIFFNSHIDALNWGVQTHNVYVTGNGS